MSKKSPQNEEFWLVKKNAKVCKKNEEKMTKFGKNGPKATRTRDHRGKAKASVKSELETAGAAIHPCIVFKLWNYILNWIFEFKKTRAALFFFSNLQSAMDFVFLDEIKWSKHETWPKFNKEHDGSG